ncbi:MAG: hypothetical protein ACK5R2_14775, partial [Cyanobacteriota bacterium]
LAPLALNQGLIRQVDRQIQFFQDLLHLICGELIALQLRELANFRRNLVKFLPVKARVQLLQCPPRYSIRVRWHAREPIKG